MTGQLHHTLIRQLAMPAVVLDGRGTIVFKNALFDRFLGLTADISSLFDLVETDELPKVKSVLQACQRSSHPQLGCLTLRHQNGNAQTFRFRGVLLCRALGTEPAQIVLMREDLPRLVALGVEHQQGRDKARAAQRQLAAVRASERGETGCDLGFHGRRGAGDL